MKKTRICEMLGIEYPIIQAPMTWITSAELVAAVCNAGGMGTLGPNAGQRTVTNCIAETGERLRREIQKTRTLTDKPFAVNLILMGEDMSDRETFGGACLRVILEEKAPVVITAGFTPDKDLVARVHDNGTLFFHREPNIGADTARMVEASGVDALIAVGFDGGGHLSAFRIPTFSLIPLITEAVDIPVIAGGGIVNRRGVEAALALGAEGVYMGTRFIASEECPAHSTCKQTILEATDCATTVMEDSLGLLVRIMAKQGETVVSLGDGSAEQVSDSVLITNTGGIREGMLEGDLICGTISMSIASSIIRDIKPAGEIVRELAGVSGI